MPLQCPHCQSTIVLDGKPPREVVCPSCGSTIPLDPGGTIGWLPEEAPRRLGKFELLEQLGVGSFGTVYKARDTDLDRLVALKIPRGGSIPRAEDLERFLREARSAAQLKHPGIVALHDAGTIDGTLCIVSEFIPGATLAERLTAQRFSFRQAAELIAEAADALHYAHQQGVVHRDVKPSNILLDLEGRPHLLDFGLAKRAADEAPLTLEGQVLGTPAYMSPEQARGEVRRVDGRSDLYSLGVLLYELLTGELPFRGQTRMLLVQVIQDEPRPPRRLNDRIPRDLETICLKAMAKEPARRYQTAGDLADDLRRFLKGEPIRARPVGQAERFRRWCRRNPALAGATAASAALLVAIAVLSVLAALGLRSARNVTLSQLERTKEAEQLARRAQEAAEKNEQAARRAEGLARRRYHAAQMNLAQQAWDSGRATATLDMLEDLRPRFDEEDLRDFEWYHLWGLCQRQRRFRLPLDRELVTCVAYAPDGRTVAAAGGMGAGRDGAVRLWDPVSGVERATLHADDGYWMTAVAFSPDSRTVATGGGRGEVILWDAATGKRVGVLRSGNVTFLRQARSLAFSPAGDVLAAGREDGHVAWWDVASRQLRDEFREHTGPVVAAAYSPDGKSLVTAAGWGVIPHKEGQTVVWDVTGPPRVVRKYEQACGVAFSPDGKTLALNPERYTRLRLIDFDTGREQVPEGEPLRGWAVAFSPDGATLAVAVGRTVVLTDLTGTRRRVLPHRAEVNGVAFSPDGRTVAAGGHDGAVTVWEVTPPAATAFEGPAGRALLAYSPDGKVLAGACQDGSVRLWDARTGAAQGSLRSEGKPVIRLAFSPDSTTLALEERYGNVEVWDVGNRTVRRVRPINFSHPTGCLAFSRNGRLLVYVVSEREFQVVDARTLEPVALLDLGHGTGPSAATFSLDGRWLVTGGRANGRISFWNTTTWKREMTWRAREDNFVHALAFSPDGRVLASGCGDGILKLWEMPSGRLRATLKGHTGDVFPVAFLPDGQVLASLSDDGVRLWDVATGQERVRLRGTALAVAPDGRSMVVGLGPEGVLRADRTPDAVAPRSELDPADPDSPVALADLGDKAPTAEERELSYLQARSRLDRLAAAFPQEPGYPREQARVLAGLGALWLAAGRLDEAEQAWRGAVELRQRLARDHPNQPGIRSALAAAHFGLGRVLLARGRPDEAEASFRRIIETLEGDTGRRLNDWAWELATDPDPRRRHAGAAVALASRAVALAPSEGMYWNTLGLAHYRAGQWKDAIAALEKARPLRAGGDALDMFVLAMTHHRLGDRDKAREWFDRAVGWVEQQKGLGGRQAAELKQLRAEAEKLLAGQ